MDTKQPPKWAMWLAKKCCPKDELEEIEGDLLEAFDWRLGEKGYRYASRKYVIDAFATLMLLRIYKPDLITMFNLQLLQNYLKTGIRFIWRTRTFSLLNIFGLALGITVAALTVFFVTDHFSYDKFHKNSSHLYVLGESFNTGRETRLLTGSSYIMGQEFPKQIAGIEASTRIKNGYSRIQRGQEIQFQEIHYADPDIFELIQFDFLKGGASNFESPYQIIVSSSFAKSLTDNKTLNLYLGEEEISFSIIGVFKDFPPNSSFQPEILLPFNFWKTQVEERRLLTWFDLNMQLMILLKPSVKQAVVEEQMNELLQKNADIDPEKASLLLLPLSELHTNPSVILGNGLRRGVDFEIIWIALGIGLLCLIISCFNFSNFSISNFLIRTREVAIRKVIGATRKTVFQQFISESMISSLLAGTLALGIILLVLPFFSDFVREEYTLSRLWSFQFFSGLLAVVVLSAILSGLYPSFVLAGSRITTALKNAQKVGKNTLVSWVFVTLQISMTIFLIVSMLTTGKQLDHLLTFDLGYDDENILSLDFFGGDEVALERFKQGVAALPEIEGISFNSGYNGTIYQPESENFRTNHMRIDENFLSLMNIPLKEGRNFNAQIGTDSRQAIIINESFQKMAGLPSPVGKSIPFEYGALKDPVVLGVVEDYNFLSPKSELAPLVLYTAPEYQIQNIQLKLQEGFHPDLINKIENLWWETFPTLPLRYDWLEEINKSEMAREQLIKEFSIAGTLMVIVLAALGLIGIVGINMRQRLKEVSIRKVVGAAPLHIYRLFIGKIGKWLALGAIAGTIPAFFFMQNWLSQYPERIDLGWEIPFAAILICGTIFLVILTVQLTKVMRVNPVVFLRND